MSELEDLTIAQAARLLRTGELSAEALTRAHLDRVAALDADLHAFITVTAETALAEARQADAEIAAGRARGPLHGIPLALKDVIATAGIRTTCHSRLMLDHVPQQDADCVARLKAAGAVLLGKLATHEFAFGGPSHDLPFPVAHNPWDLGRVTGGSSSGSGAAVAAGLCMGSVGTDTSGSIRMPAGHCGVVGLKPTYGCVSRTGVFPLSPTLDHVGPMAWTVADCAFLLEAIVGHDPRDPGSSKRPMAEVVADLDAPLGGLRIGLDPSWHEGQVDPAMSAALEDALAIWRDLGVRIAEVRLPSLREMNACGRVILLSEGYSIHKPMLDARPADYGRLTRDRMRLGAFISAEYYLKSQRLRRQQIAQMSEAMRGCDIIVTANQYGPAERFDEATEIFPFFGKPYLTMPFSLTGQPALTLPCGESAEGLPLGLQIAGRPFDEASVLRFGRALERARQPMRRRPPLTRNRMGVV